MRLVLINLGRVVLYGQLDDIRRNYAGHDVIVHAPGDLPVSIPGVISMQKENSAFRLHLSHGQTPQGLLRYLVSTDIAIDHFELAQPTLDEIFIQIVTGGEARS
jgi:ABC-2 type transport system ATP-binding protein